MANKVKEFIGIRIRARSKDKVKIRPAEGVGNSHVEPSEGVIRVGEDVTGDRRATIVTWRQGLHCNVSTINKAVGRCWWFAWDCESVHYKYQWLILNKHIFLKKMHTASEAIRSKNLTHTTSTHSRALACTTAIQRARAAYFKVLIQQ